MIDAHHGWNVSFKPLILGFLLSLILAIATYRIITQYHLSGLILVTTTVGLGCAQAFIQLVFFLHLGMESKPRWNLMMFFFTLFLVFILVGGSLWIMNNLKYNVMTPL